MDLKLKSITWVGKNISQKFETMCQEVDNIVSQDTVRYVENQMQTMGDSMKKFCSDVVQDLLPPLVDPLKHEAQEVVLKKNAAIGTYLKSIIGIEENLVDTSIKQSPVEPNTVDPVTSQLGNESSGLDLENQLITPISTDPSVGPVSGLVSAQIADALTHQIPYVNNEENSIKEKTSTSQVLESLGKEDCSEEFVDCNHKNACGFVIEGPSEKSADVVVCQFIQKVEKVYGNFADNSVSVSDASNTSAASEVAISVVHCEEKVSERGLMSSTNSHLMESNGLHDKSAENIPTETVYYNDPVDGVWSSSDSLTSSTLSIIASVKDNASEVGLLNSSSVLSSESRGEDVSGANYTLSLNELLQNSNSELCESAQLDAPTISSDNGHSHYCRDYFDYSGMENVELSDKVKLEESCVMVDSSALYAVSQRTQKLGSFKKRIQDAFASKKRLAKEYEQLAIWFGDSYIGPSQDTLQTLSPSTATTTVDSKAFSGNYISDSEWELL